MMLLVFLALCLAQSSARPTASEDFTHNSHLDASDQMHLYWKFDATHITFEVHGNTTGWVGIGVSPSGSMANADINVGWVKNGVANITDRHGVDFNGFPPLDVVENVELLGGRECDGWTTIKFRRQLAACDSEDREIARNTLKIIFAWGLRDPAGDDITHADYHQRRRGALSMLLLDQPKTQNVPPAPGETQLQYNFLNDKFSVPAIDTYYNCRFFQMPQVATKHHIIKIEQIIEPGNELTVHHMLLYQCADPTLTNATVGVDTKCQGSNMPPQFRTCGFPICAWATGGGAFYYPDHVGFPIGTVGAPKFVVLEVHYDNPLKRADIVDSSGFRITYTSNLRQYDAGIISVGIPVYGSTLVIPPNAESFSNYGECPDVCLSHSFQTENRTSINVFAVMLHSHVIGRQLTLRHIRNGTELEPLAADKSYDFNYQETRFLPQERVVMKDDTLQMVCNFNNSGRNKITVGGWGTSEEMCITFVYHYPKLGLSVCATIPYLPEFLSYFGVQSYHKTGNNTFAYTNLADYTPSAPAKFANKTAMDILNSLTWNQTMVRKFENDARNMTSTLRCYGTSYRLASALTVKPTEIVHQYNQKSLNCTAPSTGFQQSSVASQCTTLNPIPSPNPTDRPMSTTSGDRGQHRCSWLTLVALAISLLYRGYLHID